MTTPLNPGEAKQIEQDYAHTTLATSEMAASTAHAAADGIQDFLDMLRERVKAARQKDAEAKSNADDSQVKDAATSSPARARSTEADANQASEETSPSPKIEPIEIKMGREIVYRDGYADKDPINKLTPDKVKLLQAVIDTPQPLDSSLSQESTPSAQTNGNFKGSINIRAEDELVYRMRKGAVETNRIAAIQPEPEVSQNVQVTSDAELTDGKSPEDQFVHLVEQLQDDDAPIGVTRGTDDHAQPMPEPVVLGSEQPVMDDPDLAMDMGDVDNINRFNASKGLAYPEFVPEPSEELTQDSLQSPPVESSQPEPKPQTESEKVDLVTAPQSESLQTTQPSPAPEQPSTTPSQSMTSPQPSTPKVVSILEVLERQNRQVINQKTQAWMRTANRLMKRSSEQVLNQVVAVAANLRSRQVASTAKDLLQKYGEATSHNERQYQSEQYDIRAKGRMVTVSDRQGKELMMFRETRIGLDIIKNDMNVAQESEFMRARRHIQQMGIDGLSSEPPNRIKQLGNLAPAGDAGLTRDLIAVAVAQTANKLLDVTNSQADAQGKRVFEGSHYRFEQGNGTLKIEAEGRGALLSIDNGKVQSNLTTQDLTYFRHVDRQLNQDIQQHASQQQSKVTPLHARQRERSGGVAIGE